ncbi:type II toxin-antitoxin system VapC family toxin [Promineifilum sp.]|uniref:type II toxin-antitoxin system VapC family toxin n=1 Tax=Promineifilum sp. TaxID=2664178 RepID=UPI0035B3CC0E
MSIVIDANLAATIALPLNYASETSRLMRAWKDRGEYLLAPALLEYEITSTLRQAIVIGMIDEAEAVEALQDVLASGIILVPPTIELDREALVWARRIGQSKAYDAQYLALAAQENAPLWTADRRLARNARGAGLAWVHWVGGEPA